jgi:hypothetical protein
VSRIESRFPLIEAAAVYESAAVRAVQLANRALDPTMSDLDADSLAHAEDLMAGSLAALAKAGRLDMVGGA